MNMRDESRGGSTFSAVRKALSTASPLIQSSTSLRSASEAELPGGIVESDRYSAEESGSPGTTSDVSEATRDAEASTALDAADAPRTWQDLHCPEKKLSTAAVNSGAGSDTGERGASQDISTTGLGNSLRSARY